MKKIQFNKITLLFLVFFLLRIINLTKLPIFNDEAIYLDWGFRETHEPGYLFYSLYDAKQPLLMWLFGISETIFSDPLFAGRLISVLFGVLSAIGLYQIGLKLRGMKAGIVAVLCYLILPISTFYDRQALMEAAIGAIGIWIFYYLLRMRETHGYRYPIIIGLLLGIGFMIKSQSILFLIPIILLSIVSFFKRSKSITLKKLSIVFMTFLGTDILLFLQPEYWRTLSLNSKYAFSLSELLHFPLHTWIATLIANLSIIFFFVTPGIMLLSGLYLLFVLREKKKREKNEQVIVFWFVTLVLLQTVLVKGASQRYLVSYLPFIALFTAFTLTSIMKPILRKAAYLLLLPALLLSLLQLFNPLSYITFMAKLTPHAELGYVQGYTSGVLVEDVTSFLQKKGEKEKIAVGIAKNAGNPESALIAYANKSSAFTVGYMDGSDLKVNIDDYDCMVAEKPLYFVAREDQKSILGRFFDKKTVFKSPYDSFYISVYSFKTSCKHPLQLRFIK